MRLQDSQANCGPTALHNALAALGIRRTPAECERLCGTTAADGTSQDGLIAAAKTVRGCHPRVFETDDGGMAGEALRGILTSRPAILCVDHDEHYVAAIGLLGDRFLVADGAKSALVLSYSGPALVQRWRSCEYGGPTPPTYWGLIL